MNTPLANRMQEIRAMRAAMHGRKIYTKQDDGNGFVGGGKWEIVTQFNGKSHKDGGIDIEVSDGYVRRINGTDEPDDIAKNGRVWKDVGAAAYGVGEGLLDTLTFGLTDQLTDLGYTALQKAAKNTEDEIREQNSLRGYGTTAGAIGGGFITGGATTGAAIQQGAKGLGAGISSGSPDSKLAQDIGLYLPLAGQVAGMVVGNKGYTSGETLGGLQKFSSKFQKYQGFAQNLNMAATARQFLNQSPETRASYGMGAMPTGSPVPSIQASQQSAGQGFNGMLGSSKGGPSDGAVGGAAQEDIFYAQVPMRDGVIDYLSKYQVNV